MKTPPELKPFSIIRYMYCGELEYALWYGDGTRSIASTPKRGTVVIHGVWKGEKFEARKEVTL